MQEVVGTAYKLWGEMMNDNDKQVLFLFVVEVVSVVAALGNLWLGKMDIATYFMVTAVYMRVARGEYL
jgi:hypothetical protein